MAGTVYSQKDLSEDVERMMHSYCEEAHAHIKAYRHLMGKALSAERRGEEPIAKHYFRLAVDEKKLANQTQQVFDERQRTDDAAKVARALEDFAKPIRK